ncbi:REP-associated tyrosine transposase [Luteimonas cucumeris]|nr:transposase [Luteimonas cucumeris]
MDTHFQRPHGHAALRRGRASLAHHVYHVTTTTFKRAHAFSDFVIGSAAAGSFTSAASVGDAQLLAWVLMPDHVHWLLQLGSGDPLAQVVNRMKARSAGAVNAATGRRGALWDRGYHDHALRREEDIVEVARYIVANPIRARLVSRVGDYPFWDAVWL